MVAPNDESVKYEIDIAAAQALLSLRNLSSQATTTAEKIQGLISIANELKETFGGNFAKDILASMKDIDKTMSGSLGGKEWKEVENAVMGVGNATRVMGDEMEKSSYRGISAARALNIAFGALEAMLLFRLVQAFQNLFDGVIKGLREMESHVFNLANAERKLSEQGINIAPKDLDEIIAKLQKLDPLLSKVQATELVSSISTKLAPALNLGKKSIESLSQSIAILTIRNKALGYSEEEVQSQIENALLSGKISQGINKFGVALSDQIVKEEAVRLKLVANADAYDKLTGAQKKHIQALSIIKILEQSTNEERKHLPEYLSTADAAFGIFQARMSDFLTQIGTKFGPVLVEALGGFIDILQSMIDYLNQNDDAINVFISNISGITKVTVEAIGFLVKLGEILGTILGFFIRLANAIVQSFVITPIETFITIIKIVVLKFQDIEKALNIDSKQAKAFFDGIVSAALGAINTLDRFKAAIEAAKAVALGVGGQVALGEAGSKTDNRQDTPTGKPPNVQDQENRAKAIADAEKKIQEAMKDAADKKLDIERDYGRKLEDIARNYSQKLEDIARHTEEKREDALRNYNQKVEDINRDANQKMIDARTEERKKEIDREAQFQQRLKELREKFLFDLEDALRERDARAVLRLIRQYNMDKKNLEDHHKLEQQQAKKDLQQKLKDIEAERIQKLEAAKREYEDKLKEIAIGEARDRAEAALWRKRELEDAKIWHQRQLEEQRQYLQRKLRDIADALKAEYNLTSAGAQAIVKLLAATLSAQAALLSQLNAGTMQPIAANGAITGGSGGSNVYNPWYSGGKPWSGWTAAEGGNFLATRPTKLTVGEEGAEMVNVTPLDKIGNNVNNVFGDKSALGMGGNVKIALELSPDLEARIVESSLDGMSVSIERIIRSK